MSCPKIYFKSKKCTNKNPPKNFIIFLGGLDKKKSYLNDIAGLARNKISKMMDSETWFSANKAVELGFADKVLYDDKQDKINDGFIFDKVTVTNALMRKIPNAKHDKNEKEIPYEQLLQRLNLIKR